MTREEARNYLSSSGFSEEQMDTVEQAFKASEPCEDAISRQAAIDEIRFGQSYTSKISPTGKLEYLHDKENEALEEAVERIKDLPSVNAEPCLDAISRQAVIKAIYDNEERLNIAQAVRDLPSVNPQEPKTGHWIEDVDRYDREYIGCSECGAWFFGRDEKWKYCPNCGCRMVEPQESEG